MASAAVPASSRREICLLLCCFQRLAGLHSSQTDRSPWDGAIDVVSQLLCVRTEVATGMDPPSCLPALAAGELLKIVDAKFQGYGVSKMRKLLRVNQAGYRTNDGRAIGSR